MPVRLADPHSPRHLKEREVVFDLSFATSECAIRSGARRSCPPSSEMTVCFKAMPFSSASVTRSVSCDMKRAGQRKPTMMQIDAGSTAAPGHHGRKMQCHGHWHATPTALRRPTKFTRESAIWRHTVVRTPRLDEEVAPWTAILSDVACGVFRLRKDDPHMFNSTVVDVHDGSSYTTLTTIQVTAARSSCIAFPRSEAEEAEDQGNSENRRKSTTSNETKKPKKKNPKRRACRRLHHLQRRKQRDRPRHGRPAGAGRHGNHAGRCLPGPDDEGRRLTARPCGLRFLQPGYSPRRLGEKKIGPPPFGQSCLEAEGNLSRPRPS